MGWYGISRCFCPEQTSSLSSQIICAGSTSSGCFRDLPIFSNAIPPIARGWAQTTFVDLSKGQEAIYAGMHTNCRYKVRRAEKMHDRFEIVMNTEPARADFFALYNTFASSKAKLPSLKRYRFNEYLPHADVFMLYFEGQPSCGRLVLRDEESRTALMLYSGTRRLDEGADTITVGLLNRYLHWHEMKTYQTAGIERYDFGGIGLTTGSVNNFKMSFGGQLKQVSSYLYAGSARPVWKLAYSLYTRWTGESVRYTRAAAEFSTTKEESLLGREATRQNAARPARRRRVDPHKARVERRGRGIVAVTSGEGWHRPALETSSATASQLLAQGSYRFC